MKTLDMRILDQFTKLIKKNKTMEVTKLIHCQKKSNLIVFNWVVGFQDFLCR